MESETAAYSEDCDHKTRIKENVNQDKVSTKSQKPCLQNETYFEECIWKSDVGTKIGIKQETCDPNVASSVIKSDPFTSRSLQFQRMVTIKGVNEVDIKEEYFNQEEISTKLQDHSLLQNEACLKECVSNGNVDTKIWNAKHVILSDIKSDPENPPSSPGTSKIKDFDEINIKEEPWWCNKTSPDSQNEEKESDAEMIEASKEPLPLEPPRLLDVEKEGASHRTIWEKHPSQSISMRENLCSLNCNSICDSDSLESEQNKADESTLEFKCEVCAKCYRHKSSLQRHTLVHSGTTFKCDTCEKSFIQKSDLQMHTLLHSGIKPYQCDICEKGFRRKSYLLCHQLCHLGLTPYKCDRCEKCFTQKSDLKRHKLVHTGTKPHKCDKCEKCFIQKSDLQTHLLLHSGIKAHKCDICEKCFTRKSYLQCHKLSHSESKPHKCDSCEKVFTQISDLKRHKLIHTGTKPYKCDICKKCFTRKSDLKSHILLHSGIKSNECNICGRCFTWKSSLLRHTLLH